MAQLYGGGIVKDLRGCGGKSTAATVRAERMYTASGSRPERKRRRRPKGSAARSGATHANGGEGLPARPR